MKIEKIKSSENLFIDGPIILIPDKFSDERGFFTRVGIKKFLILLLKEISLLFKIITQNLLME